jgi:hypothetical protein
MKCLLVVVICLNGLMVSSQSNSDYFIKMAADAGIERPVPQKYKSLVVRVPIKTDSISMVQWRKNYILRMQLGTGLLSGGILLVAAHIFAVAFVPHFNRNAVIATAAIGVGTMSAGALLLPIAVSERHRYKKTLRIELAKRGL